MVQTITHRRDSSLSWWPSPLPPVRSLFWVCWNLSKLRGRRSEGENTFALSYHWLDREGKQTLVFDGVRTPLGHSVGPTESLQVQARILAPPHPGEYILAWDLVQEHRLWFSTAGSPSTHSLVKVYAVEGSSERRIEPPLIPLGPAPKPRLDLARPTLWRGALRMLLDRPLLGVGPDNFRLLYGNYLDLKEWRRNLHANNMYLEFSDWLLHIRENTSWPGTWFRNTVYGSVRQATTGLVGGGLFLWFIWRVISILGAQWRKMGDAELSLFLGISAATAAFLIHGLFDHFLAFTPTYVMIWVVVGLVASLPRSLTSSHPETHYLSFLTGRFLCQIQRFIGPVLTNSSDRVAEWSRRRFRQTPHPQDPPPLWPPGTRLQP